MAPAVSVAVLLVCGLLIAALATTTTRKVIVIAGNFTLNNVLVNLAQYDLESGIWSTEYEPELYLYGESNGVVWDIAVNRSTEPYNKLIVVGAFDTVARTSQVQFCSVGTWDGFSFGKVGEGLCPRGGDSSTTMFIQTTALGNDGDLFVGGTFESRVWDGKHFVSVYNIAHFNDRQSAWLPLLGGPLSCDDSCTPRVNSLAWDASNGVLYIGGVFNTIDGARISPGIAMWTERGGLVPFPGGGLTLHPDPHGNSSDGSAVALQLEPRSQSLFVAGSFHVVGGVECSTIAAWEASTGKWTCLFDASHGLSAVTAMLCSGDTLYLAGWAAPSSTWDGRINQAPYTIATLDISRYVEERLKTHVTSRPTGAPYGNGSANTSSGGRRLSRRRRRRTSVRIRPRRTSSLSAQELGEYRRRVHPVARYVLDQGPVTSLRPLGRRMLSPAADRGGNGPILRLMVGEGEYDGLLFIAGAFTNLPAVTVWSTDPAKGPSIVGVGPGEQLRGLITAIEQVSLPLADAPSPTPAPPAPAVKKSDRWAFALLSFAAILVLLGLGFAVGFSHSKGMPLSYQTIDENSDLMISLKTLSGSNDAVVDFRECFERAMIARHLPIHENLLVINPKEIILSKIIGEGSFGRVWSGKWGEHKVAVKEFVFAQAAMAGGSLQRDSIIEEIVGEAGIMAFLRHPKILQLYGCSLTMQAIWIVSELCSRGSLRMLLNDASIELTLTKKLSMCLDVADGMLYLHTRVPPIIHRDIKSHNIFIAETSPGSFVAKIGDWGSARAIALGGAKTLTHGVGTACWLAPEVINYAHSSKQSDVFAFGIVLWEMFTRLEVYEGLSAAQIISKVAHDHLRPNVPRDCPWAGIMVECWKQNASERPGFHTIMATLGKLYARCKAGGGKTRGLGLTSVSSSPALSSIPSSGAYSQNNSRRQASRLSGRVFEKAASASLAETDRLLVPVPRAPKVQSNPIKQVPFETSYSPVSKTDEYLRAKIFKDSIDGRDADRVTSRRQSSSSESRVSGSEGRAPAASDDFFIGTGSAHSSGYTVVSSIIEKGLLQQSAELDLRSAARESSKSLVIDDFTPFSEEGAEWVDSADDGSAVADAGAFDWTEALGVETEQNLSRGETPHACSSPNRQLSPRSEDETAGEREEASPSRPIPKRRGFP